MIIRRFFDSIKLSAKQDSELERIKGIVERFENLSQRNKNGAIDEVLNVVSKYLAVQEKEDNEEMCRKEGHIFDKWEYRHWVTRENVYINHRLFENYPVEHQKWISTCCRCGQMEITSQEPQELIDERNEKNKQIRIKKLESELRRLKNS